MEGAVYIVQIREFLGTNIYKIGKTKQEGLRRVRSYPNGTILLLQVACKDCNKIEKEVISLFRSKYILKQELGNEYFEGDGKSMMIDMFDMVSNEGKEKVKDNIKDEGKEDVKDESKDDVKDEGKDDVKEVSEDDICAIYEKMKNMRWKEKSVYIKSLSKKEYDGYLHP